MLFKKWLPVLIAIAIVAVGSIVFTQVQNVKAQDLSGTATNVTGTAITIGNKTLVIDSNTKIEGELAPGATVQITAKSQDDGTLLATNIKVKNSNSQTQTTGSNDDDNNTNDNGIDGLVKNLSADHSRMEVNGQIIAISKDTKVQGTLAEGAEVDVLVAKQTDVSLLATSIQVETHEQDTVNNDGGQNNVQGNGIEGGIHCPIRSLR